MSLTTTLRSAASGLQAAQASIRTVSDNIANVNTPGYVRKQTIQSQAVVDGQGQGVRIDGVKRVTDQYLQVASLTAGSDTERWSAVSQYLDNAQSLFGNPASDSFYFNRLDNVFGAFAAASDDPSSTLLRSQALTKVQDFLSESERINNQLVSLTNTVDTQALAGVDRANNLLQEISKLNVEIQRITIAGGDTSGSENIQSQKLDELAGLMNVRISPRQGGGVEVRSTEGVLLASEKAATLKYNNSATTPAYITARLDPSLNDQPITVNSGQIRGLMDLRDTELPKLYDQLGEFVSRSVDQLNAAHNASTAYPPPTTMVGRQTGMDLATAVSGFTGTSTVAIVNSSGVLQRSVAIDWTNGTMSVNGGPTSNFTPATFESSLDTALSGVGDVGFTNGVMTLTATGGNSLALDEGTSQKAGKGFSHFFGLNDLIQSDGFTNAATGLTAASPHGFTPGGQISLQISRGDGRPLQEVTVTVPAAGTMTDLLNALNNTSSGVGAYGSFALDANGVLAFTPTPPTDSKISVSSDNTARTVGNASLSTFFGLGTAERSARASRFDVTTALQQDPTKMSMGKLDLTAAVGQVAVRPGDGRGALALSTVGDKQTLFQAAGSLGQVTMTLSRYASEFGGAIGRGAAAAEDRANSADAVAKEATARRQSVEGVNLDEELVNLTTYQQAFSASARMVQAASDMFDVLLNIT